MDEFYDEFHSLFNGLDDSVLIAFVGAGQYVNVPDESASSKAPSVTRSEECHSVEKKKAVTSQLILLMG